MLRSFLLLTMTLVLSSVLAQSNKVKKDVILLDKKPVATIMGEAGEDHTLFNVISDGREIINVTNGHFNLNNPFFKTITWYTVKFSDTGKEIRLTHGGNCNAKCVVKNVLIPKDFLFDGDYIQNQDDLIAAYDITGEIAKDTMTITANHKEMLSLIRENEILRNKQKPIRLTVEREDFNSSAFTKTTVYGIVQDNVIIGSVIKKHFQNSNSQRVDYDVYEKLYQPSNGKSDVGISRVTSSFIDLEFQTVIDGKKHSINLADKYNAQEALAVYLVREGYL